MPYQRNSDPYYHILPDLSSLSRKETPIIPSDSDDMPKYAKVGVLTAGNVVYLPALNADGVTITRAVEAGDVLPVLVRRVLATGTTATVTALES